MNNLLKIGEKVIYCGHDQRYNGHEATITKMGSQRIVFELTFSDGKKLVAIERTFYRATDPAPGVTSYRK